MENFTNPTNINKKEILKLENSCAIFILGIFSVVGCWIHGITGLTFGVITLILAKNSVKIYLEAPDLYSLKSYNRVKAGALFAKIGIFLSSIAFILLIVIYILKFFTGS